MAKRMSYLLAMGVFVAAAVPVVAQMGMRLPSIRGVWNPVVGGGAVYEQVEQDGTKKPLDVSIVGKEDVGGTTGYWMELGIHKDTGDTFVKVLMVVNGQEAHFEKTVILAPGRGPIEIPASMGRGMIENPKSDLRTESEKVGSESVTTPAGTFDCEHWRAKDGTYDAWISSKVTPWGLVKGTGAHGSLTLVKLVTDAKTHITGTPMKLDPSMMGGRRGN